MKFKELNAEDKAVSPVIGVILMVAITVILAAVIGSFVLGIGGNQNAAPQVAFACDSTTLVHDGGESLNGDYLYLNSTGTAISNSDTSSITAGDNIQQSFNGKIIWDHPDTDKSQIIHEGDCT